MVGQGPRGAVGVLRADRRRLAVSVADFCRLAFASVGLDWRHYVKGDSALTRPAEVTYLCGDAVQSQERAALDADRHAGKARRDDGGRRSHACRSRRGRSRPSVTRIGSRSDDDELRKFYIDDSQAPYSGFP